VSAKFQAGDRVRMKGVKPDSPEYDTGTIVGFTFDNAKVHWETADEIYSEDPTKLEHLAPDNEHA
jgi:hypothetical protein